MKNDKKIVAKEVTEDQIPDHILKKIKDSKPGTIVWDDTPGGKYDQ